MPGVDQRHRAGRTSQPAEQGRGALAVETGDVDASGVPAGEGLADQGQGAGRLGLGAPGADHAQPRRRRGRWPAGGPACAGWPRRPSAGPPARPAAGVAWPRRRTRRAMSSQRANADLGRRRPPPSDGTSSWTGRAPEGLEHRTPRPQRRRAVVLRAAADGDGEAPLAAPRSARSLDQPGLADAGLPHDLGRGEAARGRRVEQRGQRRALGVAADRDRVGRRARRAAAATAIGRRRSGGDAGADRVRSISGRLPEDRRLQGPQPRAGVDAELLGQRGPDRPQRLEGVGLPTGAGQGQGVGGPQRLVAAGAARSRTRWSPARRRGRRPPAGPAAGPPRQRPAAARARTAPAWHVGVVGQVGVRLPRPRRERGVEPVDRGHHRLARRPARVRARLELRRQRRQHPAGARAPPRRTRARRRPRPAPAARSRGRWSR